MYEVCLLDTRKTWILSATLGGEVWWLKIYRALYFKKLLFSPFSLSLTWLAVAGLLFIFLSLSPFMLCCSDFMKLITTARKILRIFRKLSRRSTMTMPWRECSYCSETSLTGESRFHISTPLGIWTWVPCDGKKTGSPLGQLDMVRMKWDCRLSTGPPAADSVGCEVGWETCSERETGIGKLCEIKWIIT